MLTRAEIQDLASDTLRNNGMHLVNELNKGGLWSGTNLVALLEVFAERLYAAGDDNPVNIIDARMGAGWTRKLATELSRGGS